LQIDDGFHSKRGEGSIVVPVWLRSAIVPIVDLAEVEQGVPGAVPPLVLRVGVFTGVVALGQLLPLDLEPVLESVARTGSLVTVEEGTLTGGIGAEIAARVQSEAWDDLQRPVERIAARDGIIPAAPTLEEAVLPGVDDVVSAVRALGIVRS
jgi:pyruvate/2-oxoglutarate/acetoin dehydrogenase E1 component